MLWLRCLPLLTVSVAAIDSTLNFGSLPACAKNAGLDQAQDQGLNCGYDIACYCQNTTFLASLNDIFQQQCTQSDAQAARNFAQQACSSFGSSVPISSSAAGLEDNGSSSRTTSETMTSSPLSSIGESISDSTSQSVGTASSSTTSTSIPASPTTVAPTTNQPSSSPTPVSWGISISALRWQDVMIMFVASALAVDVIL